MDPHLHYAAVTAIIHKDGKYLITKRSPNEKAFPNMWTVPGGKISTEDYVSTPKTTPDGWYGAVENALKREVLEEVNIEISNVRFLLDMVFVRPDGIPVIVFSYWAEHSKGEVKLDEEGTDFSWVTLEEAEKYDLIAGIYEEIVMVDKILKGADPGTVKFEPRKNAA